MRRRLKQGRIAPRVAAVMLLLAAVCGCEKEVASPKGAAPAETNSAAFLPRTQDPAYAEALRGVLAKRNKVAARRHKIVEQMEALVAQARAALPADATEEQVRDELQNNPKKYPGWRELSRILRARNEQADKELADARRLVMARIRQEQAELSQDLSKRGGSK